MKVTDEMVEKAAAVYERSEGSMRAALEAALGAQPKMYTDILLALRGVTPGNKLAHDAASCIEELTTALSALKHQIEISDAVDPYGHALICLKALADARAVLERWGLK